LNSLQPRKFQNLNHSKNHEYDGEINETWDNYFSGTAQLEVRVVGSPRVDPTHEQGGDAQEKEKAEKTAAVVCHMKTHWTD